jgi:CheY-like chemotaxis protein
MKRIALVEDNADNRLLVGAILEDVYEIEEYVNGPDALRGIAANPPDLVLLDISLPAMDGTEVLRLLRQNASLEGLAVIALTAHAMSGDRERYLGMGFDAYVTKPIVDEDILIGEIRRLMGGERGGT